MFERGKISVGSDSRIEPLRERIGSSPPFRQIRNDHFDLSEFSRADGLVNFRHARGVRCAKRRYDFQAEPFAEILLMDARDDGCPAQSCLSHAIRGLLGKCL